jgi:hypothetical protein
LRKNIKKTGVFFQTATNGCAKRDPKKMDTILAFAGTSFAEKKRDQDKQMQIRIVSARHDPDPGCCPWAPHHALEARYGGRADEAVLTAD